MAEWTTAYVNDLPDSSFLYVKPGGAKQDGKTAPRSLRMFPVKDAEGKLDLPHLRNALARIPQADVPVEVKRSAIAQAKKLLARAKGKQGAMSETQRTFSVPLQEAGLVGFAQPTDDGVLKDCTLIRAGLNATGRRLYTEAFLRENAARFDGALCHIDHPTVREAAERPERSLREVAGRTMNVRWDPEAKGLVGDIKLLTDTPQGQQIQAAFRDDVIRETAGLSIYWPYQWSEKDRMVDGKRVGEITALQGPANARVSTDFVTMPTAGGRVGRQTK